MSVKGIELFKKQFEGLEREYALIGGSACDLLFSEQGLAFRVTKDLDIVMLAEGRTAEFATALWSFVKKGGYKAWTRRDGEAHYYRFENPRAGYPAMIELFARHPQLLLRNENSVIAPLPFDADISSLSAIILDDDYYAFLTEGLIEVEGVSVVDAAHLIPLKAKAHLDLQERAERGEHVNKEDRKKHWKDVMRLAGIIPIGSSIQLPAAIAKEMKLFLEDMKRRNPRVDQLDIGLSLGETLALLIEVYRLGE